MAIGKGNRLAEADHRLKFLFCSFVLGEVPLQEPRQYRRHPQEEGQGYGVGADRQHRAQEGWQTVDVEQLAA